MRIAIIGSFVSDTLHPYREPVRKSLGGITYTIPYLANLAEPDWEICPICVIGSDIREQVYALLSKYENVNTVGIRVVQRENTKVSLVYSTKLVRDEFTTEPMPSIDQDQLRLAAHSDVVLLNFITGNEISLADLRHLTHYTNGLIYMDYHQLARKIGYKGKRIPWKREDWCKWVNVANIVQMNEEEGGILTGKDEGASIDDLDTFGRHVAGEFGSIVNITTGDQGSLLYFLNADKVIFNRLSSSTELEVLDPTGCGDAFAAGFIVEYLKSNDPKKAAQFANLVGGFNCTFSGIQQLDELWGDFRK